MSEVSYSYYELAGVDSLLCQTESFQSVVLEI